MSAVNFIPCGFAGIRCADFSMCLLKNSYPQSVDNFHQSAERKDVVAPLFQRFLPECGGCGLDIIFVLFEAVAEILHGEGGHAGFIRFQQADEPVVREVPCRQ
jgi:hypothetical protein